MKNPTVLYIITKLELGGAQKVCLALVDGIKKYGYNPHLISGSQGILSERAKKNKAFILVDSFKREIGIKLLFQEIKTFFKIIKIIKSIRVKNPDLIVHTHSTKAGIIGRWAAFFAGARIRIHTIHGFGFNDYQSKLMWAMLFSLEYASCLITSHYVCVSIKDKSYGEKMFPNFIKKCSIIRAGIENDSFFIPVRKYYDFKPKSSFIIGTISCFKPQKNLHDLLKAFKLLHSRLANKNIHIVLQIIGDGIQRNEIEEWIFNNNIVENIQLFGWQKNVFGWMKNWDLLVMSSLWEGLPCTVVEARAAHIPVVAYDVGGIFEVIKNNKNGFLVPAGNWRELSKKIELIVSKNSTRKKFGLFEDNLEEFGNDFMIKKHADLYKKIWIKQR
jgi:glycosyltransferase involved in cell wall biosynthesis